MLATLVLFAVYLAIPGALFLWPRWLRRKTRAPSYAWRTGYALVATTAIMFALAPLAAVAFGVGLFLSVDSTPNATREHPVLEKMGEAMYGGGVVWAAMVGVTVLWLLYATWRWHWSGRAEAEPDPAPPYR